MREGQEVKVLRWKRNKRREEKGDVSLVRVGDGGVEEEGLSGSCELHLGRK